MPLTVLFKRKREVSEKAPLDHRKIILYLSNPLDTMTKNKIIQLCNTYPCL